MRKAWLKYVGMLAVLVLGLVIGANVLAAGAAETASDSSGVTVSALANEAQIAVPVKELTLAEEVKQCEEAQAKAEKQLAEEEKKIREAIAKEEAKEAEVSKAKEAAREKMSILERLNPFGEWPEPVKKLQKEVEAIEATRKTEEEAHEKVHNKFLNEHGIFSECYAKKEKLKEQEKRAAEKLKLEEAKKLEAA